MYSHLGGREPFPLWRLHPLWSPVSCSPWGQHLATNSSSSSSSSLFSSSWQTIATRISSPSLFSVNSRQAGATLEKELLVSYFPFASYAVHTCKMLALAWPWNVEKFRKSCGERANGVSNPVSFYQNCRRLTFLDLFRLCLWQKKLRTNVAISLLSQRWHYLAVDLVLNPTLQLGHLFDLHHCFDISSRLSCCFLDM